ncbi:integrase, catalytic region, zinc finger, CCHC-type containing protein, partial [Tanacetum coccineum]
MKDKVVPNTSQVKFKKTEVEDYHRISSTSNKTKFVTACNDSLKSKTSNVNAVCDTCGKCLFNSDHYAYVSKFFNDVNARTKKPKLVPISTRQPKNQANKSVATPPKKTIVQIILFIVEYGYTKHMTGHLKLLCNFVEKYLGTVHFGNDQFSPILGYEDLVQGNIMINRVYYIEGLNHNLFSVETTSSTLVCFMAKASPTQAWLWHRRLSYLNFDYINLLSKKDVVIGLPKLKYVKDQLCSSCEDETPEALKDFLTMIQRNLQALVISVRTDRDTTAPSQQELNLLFGPLYDEFFNASTSTVNKSSSPTDNSKQQDSPPTTNNPSSTEPKSPTINVHAKENNNNQVEDTQVQQAKFINPFCTPPVQTRRQLATDPEMCMFALTVSTAESKTIKEAMADSVRIE